MSDDTTTQTRNRDDKVIDMESTDTAIAKRQDSPIADRDKYAPDDFNQLMTFAKVITSSGLCPDHIDSPEDAVMIVQQGQELGLSPMQALQGLHVIRGKVGLNADTMKAVCESSGLVERWHYEQSSETTCTVVVQRTGRESYRTTWNKQRAEKAGLWSSSTYSKYPAEMLRHRADAEAARAVFPDLLLGLYTPQELRSIDENGQSNTRSAKPDTSGGVNDMVRGDGNGKESETSRPEDPKPHWSQQDWSHLEPDDDEAWTNAMRHLCGVISNELGDRKEAVLAGIAKRHNVDSKKQIPGETLGQWAEKLDGDAETCRKLAESID